MPEWNRETPWRQGHVLTHAAAIALNLVPSEPADRSAAVVISHDCDLAADASKEPNVEIIRATLIDGPEGQFTYSKNARTLHLQFTCGSGPQWVELQATEKFVVPKSDLATFAPQNDFKLDRRGHSILQSWLAARYRRSAFPDSFVDRLKNSGLDSKLAAILKPHGDHIRSIFFDLEDDQVEKTGPDDTYSLRIYVLYATESDAESASLSAERVRDEIEATFRRKLFQPLQQWNEIELCECVAVADEVLTVAHATRLKEWRLEHLSLREDPPHPMLSC